MQVTGETLERALAVLSGDTTDTESKSLVGTGSTSGTEGGAGADSQSWADSEAEAETTDGAGAADGAGVESGGGSGKPLAGDGRGAPPKLRSVPSPDPGVGSAAAPGRRAEPAQRPPRPRRPHLRGL